jgi:hypothetical protein
VLRVSSSSSFVPRLDSCLKPVEIHIFEVRAAQLFVVSCVEPVEPNGIEDLPEWSSVAKDPDECSFTGRAIQLNVMAMRCSLWGCHASPRPYAVACLAWMKKLTHERQAVRNFGTVAITLKEA